jgi:hypothetical protein
VSGLASPRSGEGRGARAIFILVLHNALLLLLLLAQNQLNVVVAKLPGVTAVQI